MIVLNIKWDYHVATFFWISLQPQWLIKGSTPMLQLYGANFWEIFNWTNLKLRFLVSSSNSPCQTLADCRPHLAILFWRRKLQTSRRIPCPLPWRASCRRESFRSPNCPWQWWFRSSCRCRTCCPRFNKCIFALSLILLGINSILTW